VNVTAIVQLECADTVPPPHVPPVTAKSPAFAPPTLPSPTDNENPDKSVTVMFMVFDLVVSVPNASVLAGEIVAGIVGPVLIATVCGLDASGLSAIDSVADSVPSTPGLNFTEIEHVALAASVDVHVLVPLIEKSPALVPLKLSLRLTDRV